MADIRFLDASSIESIGNFTQAELIVDTGSVKATSDDYLSLVGTSVLQTNTILNTNFNFVAERIAEPIYTLAAETFGQIEHIDPLGTYYDQAFRGINDLRLELGVLQLGETGSVSSEDSLLNRIGRYLEGLYAAPNANLDELDNFFGDFIEAGSFIVPDLGAPPEKGAIRDGSTVAENDQTALFSLGRQMRVDIRFVQRLRSAILSFRKFQQRRLNNLHTKLADTETEIVDAQKELSNLNRKRLESVADYQVVRQLVVDDWKKVESEYDERARILNAHQGIYYTRVRETPVNALPPDPLALRFSRPDDLVPGCPLSDKDLPEDLEPFMESVLDIAVADWRTLRPLYRQLPARRRLNKLVTRRNLRLDHRLLSPLEVGPTPLAARMSVLQQQNVTLIRDVARRPFLESKSLSQYQWSAAQLISLEDLLNGPPHRLRASAENLRNKLDQAAHCLLEQLRRVRPSIRLDWSNAAENDTLAVEKPSQWPGLELAEEDDFNGIRTVIDLVHWWFRQLADKAHSSSYSALRNFVRACLMIAASDDPEEILHGNLMTVPPRLRVGEALRLQLNKEALAGTRLQLLDGASQLVGTLTVEDYDDNGAIATVTQVHQSELAPTTSFTVSGYMIPGSTRIL